MEMWLKLEFIFQKTSQDNFLLQLPLLSGQLDYILIIFVFFLCLSTSMFPLYLLSFLLIGGVSPCRLVFSFVLVVFSPGYCSS